jgi:hypothetical protein
MTTTSMPRATTTSSTPGATTTMSMCTKGDDNNEPLNDNNNIKYTKEGSLTKGNNEPLAEGKDDDKYTKGNNNNKYKQTTTNQKHAGTTEEEKERRCDWGEVWGKCILSKGK